MNPSNSQVEAELQKIVGFFLPGITVDGDFFEYGMDSLTATQIISRIDSALGKRLRFKDIFENPSINKLSYIVYNSTDVGQQHISKLPAGKYYDASFLQKKEYLTNIIKNENIFNINFSIEIENVNKQFLENAVRQLAERHESLRTIFLQKDGKILQRIIEYDSKKFRIFFWDLSHHNSQIVHQYRLDLLNKIFDFEQGPLFAVDVLQVNSEQSILQFVIHHAVSDVNSIKILVKELLHIYNSFVNDNIPALEPLPVQLKEYCYWNNITLDGHVGEDCKSFYKKRIGDSLKKEGSFYGHVFDFKRNSYREQIVKEIQDFTCKTDISDYSEAIGTIGKLRLAPAATYSLFLKREILLILKRKAIHFRTSLPILLVSVYCLTMYKHKKQSVFRIDIPVTNRIFEEFENITGWLMGGIIACIDIDEQLSLKDFIAHVTDRILETSEYRYYPLERILLDFDLPVSVIAPTQINYIDCKDQTIDDFKNIYSDGETAYYDMTYNILEYKNGLQFLIRYDLNLFSIVEVEKIGEEYKNTMLKILQNPNTLIPNL